MLALGSVDMAAAFAARTVTVPASLLTSVLTSALSLAAFGLPCHALGALVPILTALAVVLAILTLLTVRAFVAPVRPTRLSLLLRAICCRRWCFSRPVRRRCRCSGFRCRLSLLMTLLAAWPMRAPVSASRRPPHFDER